MKPRFHFRSSSENIGPRDPAVGADETGNGSTYDPKIDGMPSILLPVEGMISKLSAPQTDVFLNNGLPPIGKSRTSRQVFTPELMPDDHTAKSYQKGLRELQVEVNMWTCCCHTLLLSLDLGYGFKKASVLSERALRPMFDVVPFAKRTQALLASL